MFVDMSGVIKIVSGPQLVRTMIDDVGDEDDSGDDDNYGEMRQWPWALTGNHCVCPQTRPKAGAEYVI